jgi:hypothetical protein
VPAIKILMMDQVREHYSVLPHQKWITHTFGEIKGLLLIQR